MNGSYPLFLLQFYHALLLPIYMYMYLSHQLIYNRLRPTAYSCSRPDKFSFSNQSDERQPPTCTCILWQVESRGLHLASNPKSCFSRNGESRKPCTCTTPSTHTKRMWGRPAYASGLGTTGWLGIQGNIFNSCGHLVSQAVRIFPRGAHARGKGGGGRNEKIRLVTYVPGFRSICRNVGRANQIWAFKVIEYCCVKFTWFRFSTWETANL